jgi:hypothetical protein
MKKLIVLLGFMLFTFGLFAQRATFNLEEDQYYVIKASDIPTMYKDKYESIAENDITISTGYMLLENDTLTVSVAFYTPEIEAFYMHFILMDERIVQYEEKDTFSYIFKDTSDDVLFEIKCYVNPNGVLMFLLNSSKTGHFVLIVDK